MKIDKEFKKIKIYITGEDLQLLDNFFQALPECEFKDEVHLLSEQRALVAGSLLSSVLKLIEELRTRKG